MKVYDDVNAFVELVRSGNVREEHKVRSLIQLAREKFRIIGFDHEEIIENGVSVSKPSVTLVGTQLLRQARMHDGRCERGWIDTELRSWLNSYVLAELPAELSEHIAVVRKRTHNFEGKKFRTDDKLFIPSESELFGSAIYAEKEDGKRYEAFSTRKHRIMRDANNEQCWYWSRSAHGGNSTHFCTVGSNGHAGNGSAGTASRVPLCFTIA
jgi:hypothetical protein